jgi:hypothetical protein
MRLVLVLATATAVFGAGAVDWPTGNRTTPPTINSVAPLGVSRGAAVEMTVEGLNLAGASAVYFSEPGIQARILRVKELPDLPDVRLGSNGTPSTIDLGPLPPRNQVTLELEISPDAEIGPVGFRLQTPLGTSPEARFVIEPYYGESPDREPNDSPEEAFESYQPTILVGAVSRPGDLDYYKLTVKAGEQLVFENTAAMLNSSLQPVVALYDAGLNLLREFGGQGGREAQRFAYRFEEAGTYYVRVSDYQSGGSARHFYRILAGNFPIAVSAFPLGLRKGESAEIALAGHNLGAGKAAVKGEPSPEDERAVIFRPQTPSGSAFNQVKLALGEEPEIAVSGSHTSLSAAQPITPPVTVNGKMLSAEHNFRFRARKGEKLVFDVAAARLGSELDSIVEVLHPDGKPVERATLRAAWETSVTLRDHDSASAGIRITAWDGLQVGDTVLVGSELLEVEAMPRTPDDDMRFTAFDGQRQALLDTSPEAHALDAPVYKVQIHPAGAQFASNGLPVVRLSYRNDDGGPGYGKDSRLRFTAPADGEYIVRLRDVRGHKGEPYAYRVTVRPPRPDFQLSVTPRNPNVPRGGRIPVTVTALRLDDFDGPIEVSLEGLPAGLTSGKGIIAPGQVSTTLLLSAGDSAAIEGAVPLRVTGRAQIDGRLVAHAADPADELKLIALMPRPDIIMTSETTEVVLEPGGTAEVAVAISRNNQYGGRVPVEVRNLPPGVRVLDVGLNGVLINEDEDRRTFTLEALPTAESIEQPIVLSGKIETRAGAQQTSYASQPVVLRVKRKAEAAGRVARSAGERPSADR